MYACTWFFLIHNVETKEWIRVESMVTKVEQVSRHDVFVVPSTTKPFNAWRVSTSQSNWWNNGVTKMTCFNYSQKFIARGWQGKLLNLKAGGNATLHQNFNIRRIVVVLLAQFSGMPGAHWASFRFYPLVYPCSRLHRRTYSNSDLVTLVSIRIERSSHVKHVMHYLVLRWQGPTWDSQIHPTAERQHNTKQNQKNGMLKVALGRTVFQLINRSVSGQLNFGLSQHHDFKIWKCQAHDSMISHDFGKFSGISWPHGIPWGATTQGTWPPVRRYSPDRRHSPPPPRDAAARWRPAWRRPCIERSTSPGKGPTAMGIWGWVKK